MFILKKGVKKMMKTQIISMTKNELKFQNQFWHVCPDATLEEKMAVYAGAWTCVKRVHAFRRRGLITLEEACYVVNVIRKALTLNAAGCLSVRVPAEKASKYYGIYSHKHHY